jgi:hypothetical protein
MMTVQVCPQGWYSTNEPTQAAYQLQADFLPAAQFARLQKDLLTAQPVMRKEHIADGMTAVNVNFNLAGTAVKFVGSAGSCSI